MKHQLYTQTSLEGLRDISMGLWSVSGSYLLFGVPYVAHYLSFTASEKFAPESRPVSSSKNTVHR